MRRRSFIACLPLAAALLGAACHSSPTEPEVLTVRSGTFFGMCPPGAYCETTLEVASGSAVLTTIHRGGGSNIVIAGTLAAGEWAALIATVDEGRLRSLPAIIGCPDCADGGAEWIEVTTSGWTKKVTFEFGSSPGGMEALATRVRSIRARLNPPAGSAAPVPQG
jgi:hypothetical protein